jgi:predicted kinase
VNAVEPARGQWRRLAERHDTPLAIVEVVCSDPEEHRRRLEVRERGIEGFAEPTWEAVQRLRGEYEPWTERRLTVDSMADVAANAIGVLEYLAAVGVGSALLGVAGVEG